MNWLPIAGAKKDGTEYDLWITPNSMRIANCKFMDGAWREFDNHEASWVAIDKFNVTHYCEITPPQEPLSWPDKNGYWWVKFHNGPANCIEISDIKEDSFFAHDVFAIRHKPKNCDWKFLPAHAPSFGDAP
jgi:hypothetical protein